MAQVQINVAAFNRFLNKTVQPYLQKKAEEVAEEARKRAPAGATNELKSSISVEAGPRGSVRVKVEAEHAGFVHQGTGPQHQPNPRPPYFPKLRRRGLILWSEAKGADPYAVAHGIAANGTPANPFLEESLEKVLGRFNFKWIRRDIKEI